MINPAFRCKVEDILAKPNPELEKMKETIEKTLLGKGGVGEAFWICVKQKIE